MFVTNMISDRTNKPVTNQFVITHEDVTVFQSYQTTVATIDRKAGTIKLGENWDCSVTTGRYRNQFFELMGLSEIASKRGILDAVARDGRVTDDHCNEFVVMFE